MNEEKSKGKDDNSKSQKKGENKNQKENENENTVSSIISSLKKDSPEYEKSKIDELLENLSDGNDKENISRHGAFNEAKKNHNIPKCQSLIKWNIIIRQNI